MLIMFVLVCFWYQEAIGHVVFTSQDPEPLQKTPYDSQFDTYYDGWAYFDQSYYYDDIPETTKVYAVNTKSGRTNFNHQGIKNKPNSYDLHGYQRIDTSERVKVDYTRKVGTNYNGIKKSRAFDEVHRRNNGLDGHNRLIGIYSSGGSQTKSERGYHNRDTILRNENVGYRADYSSGVNYITHDRSTGKVKEIKDYVTANSGKTGRPIIIPYSQLIATIVPIGSPSTTQSPFLDDVTKSRANKTPRQGSFQESVSTTPIIQNTGDSQGRSSSQRVGIRKTSEGVSYVRGLMLSVLRRTQNT
ncbi:uncharacterized protein LOC117333871 [Pecten maximus]|uniref:uncharacterized protein LOC117333871 n=1 Tax=Pecten maximus TaxID=6579 RepID=UPI0014589172|nr:uncharacterized protein LOC117333871 [Pecten maximus]